MIECPNCNNFFDEDFDFCPYCGEKNDPQPDILVCSKCGFESTDFSFCPNCGIKLRLYEYYKLQLAIKIKDELLSANNTYTIKLCDDLINNDFKKTGKIDNITVTTNLEDYVITRNDEITNKAKSIPFDSSELVEAIKNYKTNALINLGRYQEALESLESQRYRGKSYCSKKSKLYYALGNETEGRRWHCESNRFF